MKEKKKKEETTGQNIMSASATQGNHNNDKQSLALYILSSSLFSKPSNTASEIFF